MSTEARGCFVRVNPQFKILIDSQRKTCIISIIQ